MNEKIRDERQRRIKAIVDAATKHLENARLTLEDTNLYSDEEQEHHVDTLVTRITDVLTDLQKYLG